MKKTKVHPWRGGNMNEDCQLIIEACREALSAPDRDGNSVLSHLMFDTEYPYWEGEEETIKKLALLGVVTDKEYNLKMGK